MMSGPRPPVGLFGMAQARGDPTERPFEKAEGMLQVEAPDVGAPEDLQLRRSFLRTMPP
jgi:hypothetical protein